MRGASIIDGRGRFLWNSWEVPSIAGKYRGKPLWHWMDERNEALTKEALCSIVFGGEKSARVEVLSGPEHERFLWACEIKPLPSAAYVVAWQRKPVKPLHLTPREKQVLLAMCNDEALKVTAKRLGVSPKTIDTFRAHLRKKIGAQGTAGIVRWAILNGYIEP